MEILSATTTPDKSGPPSSPTASFSSMGTFFPLVLDAEEWGGGGERKKRGDLFLSFESSSRPKMASGSPLDPSSSSIENGRAVIPGSVFLPLHPQLTALLSVKVFFASTFGALFHSRGLSRLLVSFLLCSRTKNYRTYSDRFPIILKAPFAPPPPPP